MSRRSPELRRLLELHGLEEMADVRARLAGDDIVEPGRVGLGVGGGDDFHAVAVFELGAQRHQFVVDLDGDAAVADIGVHGVGKIHRGGAARQRHDLALGGEDVDLVGEQVDLEVLQELDRVAALRLDLQQALQPLVGLLLQVVDAGVAALVQPVRGDAGLGDLVHVLGADLHLDRRAERAEQRGVQRLVAVRLGDGDVVLELAGNRLVEPVQRAQREIAGGHVLDHDAKAVDVEAPRRRPAILSCIFW